MEEQAINQVNQTPQSSPQIVDKPLRANDFLRIFNSSGDTFEEKMTATYMLAMQEECFKHYRFRPCPPSPKGFDEDFMFYKGCKLSEKADVWRTIQAKYSDYFRSIHEIKAMNSSDKHFLTEMKDHFEKIKATTEVFKINDRLNEFNETNFTPF